MELRVKMGSECSILCNFEGNNFKMSAAGKKIYSEEELFQIRLHRSYEERYKILMQLIRMSRMIRTAKISYPEKP